MGGPEVGRADIWHRGPAGRPRHPYILINCGRGRGVCGIGVGARVRPSVRVARGGRDWDEVGRQRDASLSGPEAFLIRPRDWIIREIRVRTSRNLSDRR